MGERDNANRLRGQFYRVQGGTLEAEARQHSEQFEGPIISLRRDCCYDPVPDRLRRVPRHRHIKGTFALFVRYIFHFFLYVISTSLSVA